MAILPPLLFLGPSETGKSTVANILAGDYSQHNTSYDMTFEPRSIDRKVEIGKGNTSSLIIVDTPGHSITSYKLHSLYNLGAIFCYFVDLTRKSTVDEVRILLDDTLPHRNKQKGIIIGTKSDLATQQAVSQQVMQDLATKYDLEYLVLSKNVAAQDIENKFLQFIFANTQTTIDDEEDE